MATKASQKTEYEYQVRGCLLPTQVLSLPGAGLPSVASFPGGGLTAVFHNATLPLPTADRSTKNTEAQHRLMFESCLSH